jgi:AcrR family transcriptional regulator
VAVSAQEAKRRQIMEAAVRAFARKGYHSTRVGEIAEEAGVAYGLVYHYFGSKKEVLEEIFRDTWTQMLARIREVADSNEPAREQVRKVTALLLRTWRAILTSFGSSCARSRAARSS